MNKYSEYFSLSNNIHLIKIPNGDNNIAFHIPSNSIFHLSNKSFIILKFLKLGMSTNQISKKTNIPKFRVTEFLNQIIKVISEKSIILNNNNSNIIDRITLHVSNDCNLRCRYCYANGGNYSNIKKLMEEKKALEILDFFINKFKLIKTIVFFGGEPFLNLKVINCICKYLTNLYKIETIKYLPEFIVVTNGTIINNKIVELINKYNLSITVSIDGPKTVNDLNRIFKNKLGTFYKIQKFIKIIKKKTNAEIQFEATFTHDHVVRGYSEDDISVYMKRKFGLDGTVVPVQNYNKTNNSKFEKERYDNFFLKLNKMFDDPNNFNIIFDSNILRILRCIINKTSSELCPIGSKIIAVSVDGKIYPCHIVVGKEHLCLGDINGDNIFTDPQMYNKSNLYLKLIKKESIPCKNCWARNLCSGCSLKCFYNNEFGKLQSYPDSNFCKMQKKLLTELLKNISKLQEDQLKWGQFIARLNIQSSKKIK